MSDRLHDTLSTLRTDVDSMPLADSVGRAGPRNAADPPSGGRHLARRGGPGRRSRRHQRSPDRQQQGRQPPGASSDGLDQPDTLPPTPPPRRRPPIGTGVAPVRRRASGRAATRRSATARPSTRTCRRGRRRAVPHGVPAAAVRRRRTRTPPCRGSSRVTWMPFTWHWVAQYDSRRRRLDRVRCSSGRVREPVPGPTIDAASSSPSEPCGIRATHVLGRSRLGVLRRAHGVVRGDTWSLVVGLRGMLQEGDVDLDAFDAARRPRRRAAVS